MCSVPLHLAVFLGVHWPSFNLLQDEIPSGKAAQHSSLVHTVMATYERFRCRVSTSVLDVRSVRAVPQGSVALCSGGRGEGWSRLFQYLQTIPFGKDLLLMFAASYSLGLACEHSLNMRGLFFFVHRVLFFLVRQSNWKLIPNRCEVAMRRRSTLRSNPDSVNLKSIWMSHSHPRTYNIIVFHRKL